MLTNETAQGTEEKKPPFKEMRVTVVGAVAAAVLMLILGGIGARVYDNYQLTGKLISPLPVASHQAPTKSDARVAQPAQQDALQPNTGVNPDTAVDTPVTKTAPTEPGSMPPLIGTNPMVGRDIGDTNSFDCLSARAPRGYHMEYTFRSDGITSASTCTVVPDFPMPAPRRQGRRGRR